MDRFLVVALMALSVAPPAFGQCQLCAPGSGSAAKERAIPLTIDVEAALDSKVLAHYAKLTEAEIKTLVVDDKWLRVLDTVIHGSHSAPLDAR